MPLYDYKCKSCGEVTEFFTSVDDRVQVCPACGGTAERKISAFSVRPPMQPYRSPIDGRWIDGERARREDLARNGCIPYEPEMRQDVERNAREAEVKLDKAVDLAVEETWSQLKH